MGSRTSASERVEVFAPGVSASAEDFKRFMVNTGVRHVHRRWFAEKGYDAQLKAFLESVRDGTRPSVNVRDGARATIGCLRMLEAARTGTTVPIGLSALESSALTVVESREI